MATLTRFAQALRTPDLRKKLLFTLFLIALFRFGSALPAPGISAANVRYCSGLESSRGGAANLYTVLNIFSGNSLLHVTVFALGIKQIESQLQQHHYEGFLRRSARPAENVMGTPEAPAALTVS